MNMREMFVTTTNELINKDKRVALILGGISVASFAESIEKYPERVFINVLFLSVSVYTLFIKSSDARASSILEISIISVPIPIIKINTSKL